MDGAVCIANIDHRGRRRRQRMGVASLVAAAAWTVVTWVLALPTLVRLPAVLLFFGGFLGVFQARAKT